MAVVSSEIGLNNQFLVSVVVVVVVVAIAMCRNFQTESSARFGVNVFKCQSYNLGW